MRYNLVLMHARRFACFVLGLWLGGGLFMAWVATQNFRMADRLVSDASPAARLELKAMGPRAQAILRYQASEENRRYFELWETAQIGLGFAFFALMLFGSRENQFLLGGILLLVIITALQRFLLTPEITADGRMLDWAEGAAAQGARNQFWVLHTTYVAVEAGKWLLTAALAARMVFSRKGSGRSRDSRRQFDGVNKSNYRRVNG